MNTIDKYFDKVTFAGLMLVMPATIILISILLKIIDVHFLFNGIFYIKKAINPYLILNITSLLSLIICFSDILRINSRKSENISEEKIVYNKSFIDTAIIFINTAFVIFIYLYFDFVKFGSIPVGRN